VIFLEIEIEPPLISVIELMIKEIH